MRSGFLSRPEPALAGEAGPPCFTRRNRQGSDGEILRPGGGPKDETYETASKEAPAPRGDETYWEALRSGEAYLRSRGIESPRVSAGALLEKTTGLGPGDVLREGRRMILPDEQIRYRRFLEKRAASYPLQYLLGEVCFRGLLVKVGEGVLIPRPETEFLMDALGELFDARKEFRALDVGTGSGNLALSIASEFPLADVFALDLSETALALARENAERCGLAGRVRFLKSDLFEGLPEGLAFDCILSNPPYVAAREKDQLSKELSFEPAEALFGGEDGLSVIERILDGAGGRLGAGGHLLLEMGAGQRETISRYAGRRGFDTLSVRKDYTGIERIITLRKQTWKN